MVLKDNNIPSAVYYRKPLHLQEAFKEFNYKSSDFIVSVKCSSNIWSIPIYPYLSNNDQEKIIKILGGKIKV